ncbi:hypothetical protein HYU19_00475 [Candidatus Woesearchaeota archaeon]|nr:hypothetical protein [Candidatus Woesearchaeota archaeon]
MERCDECEKGQLRKKNVPYKLLGRTLGTFEALVCDSCGETLYDAATLEKIQEKARGQGIWGLAAKTRIGTSGNAMDVKIPKSISKFLQLKKGQEVIIEPVDEGKFQVSIVS